MRRSRYAAPAAVLALALAGCSGSGDDQPAAGPSEGSSTGSVTASADGTPSESPTGSGGATTSAGGTYEEPEVLQATTDLLDWKPVPGPVSQTVTTGGGHSLAVDQGGSRAVLTGGPKPQVIRAGARNRISDTFLNFQWAVVVLQDKQEQRPASALVVNLTDRGGGFRLDGTSDVPTINGGTWAFADGTLVHPTVSGPAYCAATVDFASRRSTLGWCAPARHGFNHAHVTPGGVSLQSFDDSQPSCRTVVTMEGRDVEPFPGMPECSGFDGALTGTGEVWSDIPKERRIEAAHFYAREGDGYFDLGPGTSGTLTWCAGAAYFVRDSQGDTDPARLMRWAPDDGLSVAYESPRGPAFLDTPRCGGDALTVTATAEGGDEQVSASVG